jgi:hypothetical protein
MHALEAVDAAAAAVAASGGVVVFRAGASSGLCRGVVSVASHIFFFSSTEKWCFF